MHMLLLIRDDVDFDCVCLHNCKLNIYVTSPRLK